MNLAEKIRELSQYVEKEAIAAALGESVDVVEGVLNGTIDEEKFANYDPSAAVQLVEKKVITRGRVISVLQNSALTAEMAMAISNHNSVAVIDIEEYPVTPLYFGISIGDMPQYTNIIWDGLIDKKAYQGNLYLYSLAPGQKDYSVLMPIFESFTTTVINVPYSLVDIAQKLSDVIYMPVAQNMAGVLRVKQVLSQYAIGEKLQIVWVTEQNSDMQYMSILRQFANVQVAGSIPELNLNISPQKYQKYISKILEPLYPEQRKTKRFGLF